MRFLVRAASVLFAFGLLGLMIATGNELFKLGMFPDGYPSFSGGEDTASYGRYMAETAIYTAVCGIVGFALWSRFGDRA
jgi:hypothetical protein